eukprot:6271105-Amphidinium_carterae.1
MALHVVQAGQTTSVKLLRTNDPAKRQAAVAELQAQFGPSLVIIDFTHPTAMNANAEAQRAKHSEPPEQYNQTASSKNRSKVVQSLQTHVDNNI